MVGSLRWMDYVNQATIAKLDPRDHNRLHVLLERTADKVARKWRLIAPRVPQVPSVQSRALRRQNVRAATTACMLQVTQNRAPLERMAVQRDYGEWRTAQIVTLVLSVMVSASTRLGTCVIRASTARWPLTGQIQSWMVQVDRARSVTIAA